jgi:hypothetical protein
MEIEMLRRMVWEEMLYADMRANYFAELVGHYQNLDRSIRVCVLATSSGAAATTLSGAPPEIKLGLPLVAAGGSFWLLFSRYGMMARDAGDLHVGWYSIRTEYERLWNALTGSNAEAQYHQIYDRAEILSKTGTKFPNKKRRLRYWLEQATQLDKLPLRPAPGEPGIRQVSKLT